MTEKREPSEWVKKGETLYNSMNPEDQETIVGFVFRLVLGDVRMGLAGENTDEGGFFQTIDAEYQKSHADCYFSDQVDGNAVRFIKNTKICVLCAVKVKNILRTFMDKPKVPGKLLH